MFSVKAGFGIPQGRRRKTGGYEIGHAPQYFREVPESLRADPELVVRELSKTATDAVVDLLRKAEAAPVDGWGDLLSPPEVEVDAEVDAETGVEAGEPAGSKVEEPAPVAAPRKRGRPSKAELAARAALAEG